MGCKAPIMGFVQKHTPVHCGTRALHNDKGIYNPEIDGLNIPSGKRLHNHGNEHFLMGKLTISMAIFNSYVSHDQRVNSMNTHSWLIYSLKW